MKYLFAAVTSFVLLLLGVSSAWAAIISVIAPVVQIAPPASVAVNALQSDTQIRAFDEQQNVTLAAPLAVDITSPGTYDNTNPITPGTIPAGTVVSSHFIHFDPATDTSTHIVAITGGSARFDHQIIGVIITDANLNASDSKVGAIGTTYPFGVTFRGLEFVGFEGDSIRVACDTVTVNRLTVQGQTDQFRVITGSQICTPTAVTLSDFSARTDDGRGVLILGLGALGILMLGSLAFVFAHRR